VRVRVLIWVAPSGFPKEFTETNVSHIAKVLISILLEEKKDRLHWNDESSGIKLLLKLGFCKLARFSDIKRIKECDWIEIESFK
jgi:hypothetical protein